MYFSIIFSIIGSDFMEIIDEEVAWGENIKPTKPNQLRSMGLHCALSLADLRGWGYELYCVWVKRSRWWWWGWWRFTTTFSFSSSSSNRRRGGWFWDGGGGGVIVVVDGLEWWEEGKWEKEVKDGGIFSSERDGFKCVGWNDLNPLYRFGGGYIMPEK